MPSGEMNALKTECFKGHPFDDANTRMNKGSRVCRACMKEHAARYREANRQHPRTPPKEKPCSACGLTLNIENFARCSGERDGHVRQCRRCSRAARLLREYGITIEEYELRLADQGGVCAICDGLEPNPGRSLAVDHHHVTGVFRGILCRLCNTAIGQLAEDPKRLARAIQYLERDI